MCIFVLSACVLSTTCMPSIHGGPKRASDSWNWSYR